MKFIWSRKILKDLADVRFNSVIKEAYRMGQEDIIQKSRNLVKQYGQTKGLVEKSRQCRRVD